MRCRRMRSSTARRSPLSTGCRRRRTTSAPRSSQRSSTRTIQLPQRTKSSSANGPISRRAFLRKRARSLYSGTLCGGATRDWGRASSDGSLNANRSIEALIGADIDLDVNRATSPVHIRAYIVAAFATMQARITCGARNHKGCPAVAKRKAPDLFARVRGSETLDISYSHSVTNPVRVLSMRVASYRLRADSCAIWANQALDSRFRE